MNKYRLFVLAIAVTILSCPGYTNATILGMIEYDDVGRGGGEFSEMNFSISYPLPFDWRSVSFSWNVTADDVGKTFSASADTHQNFDIFSYFLTNGIDNWLYLSGGHDIVGDAVPFSQYESVLINGIQDGVDFEGFTIDSIGLTINELFLDYDADAIKGGLTRYNYDITYTINGTQVPEPATLFLLGFGAFIIKRKKRH